MLLNESPRWKSIFCFVMLSAVCLMVFQGLLWTPASAQEGSDSPSADLAGDEPGTDTEEPETAAPENAAPAAPSKVGGLKVLTLLRQGGWFFMVPIWVVSIGVLTMTIERVIGLRRGRVIPDGLVSGLGRLGGKQGGFDPRQAYKLCQQFPSSASTVIRAMLLKVGRPHSEVEHAVQEASEREANRLYTNVRWLSLAAAVAPLWGLLGTVWGMITAFYDTAQLSPGQNKAEVLAGGIYTALVTTLCGLFIAIPSAVMAHYFEGRITSLFHQIDELLFNLLPQVERYEGRVRFNRQMDDEPADVEPPPVEGEPKSPRRPATTSS